MSETHAYKVGQTVDAFHPGMFGVVKTGAVVKVGRKYVHIDFGPLLGGTWRVHPNHVNPSADAR